MSDPLGVGQVGSFPTTQWSLVGRAADQADPELRRVNLERLLRQYLPSLRKALLILGIKCDNLEDVLQGFICDRVIQKNILSAADKTRGRFRSFIFTSLRNFAFNQARADSAAKRAPERVVALDGNSALELPAGDDGARDLFDTAWLRDVLAQGLSRMRARCERAPGNGARVWQVFEWRILSPATSGGEPPPYDVIAAKLGDVSPLQAANLLVTAKRMFERELRAVIAEYSRDEQEVDEEINSLKALC